MSESRTQELALELADVAIVGGGPAGLSAAAALAGAGAGRIVVLDREVEMGGIPRHAHHQGFGVRDLRRMLSGPRYAARLANRAAAGGAELRAETQVTGWAPDDGAAGLGRAPGVALELTSPRGRSRLSARAIVLATGCRERPRSARLVPGSRPQGVMTTGTLQQLVYLHGQRPGGVAVIVGAEHVSFSALLTLAHGGARAAAIVTDQPSHESFGVIRTGAAVRYRTPVWTNTSLTAIHGRRRVEAVELTRLDTGEVRRVSCDLVVFTSDWIPDHELAVLGGLDLDPGTCGPVVDPSLRSSRPGLFAAGNVLHGAEPADVAALSGNHAAASVIRHLRGEPWPAERLSIRCEPPLLWISPNAVARTPDRGLGPARGRFLLRAAEALVAPVVELSQDGRSLWRGRVPRVGPGRSANLPPDWTSAVERDGGAIVARILSGRRRFRPAGGLG